MVTSRFIDEHGELVHVERDGDELVLGGEDVRRLQSFELTEEMRQELVMMLIEPEFAAWMGGRSPPLDDRKD